MILKSKDLVHTAGFDALQSLSSEWLHFLHLLQKVLDVLRHLLYQDALLLLQAFQQHYLVEDRSLQPKGAAFGWGKEWNSGQGMFIIILYKYNRIMLFLRNLFSDSIGSVEYKQQAKLAINTYRTIFMSLPW